MGNSLKIQFIKDKSCSKLSIAQILGISLTFVKSLVNYDCKNNLKSRGQ